jgi:hypothetical protein
MKPIKLILALFLSLAMMMPQPLLAASKGNTFENDLLLLIFNNTNAANVGDATGLRGSSTAGSLYVSLHSADPGETGDQTTSECAYTSYARVAVARSSGGWTVTANSVSPASTITFPAATGSTCTAAYWAVGTASSGTGKILYYGTVSPSMSISNGVTPTLTTSSAITED